MREFDNVKDMVYCEIDEISRQGKLDMNTVEVLGELVDILKDIGTIEMYEDGLYFSDDEPYENGYSRIGYPGKFPMYYRNNSYDNGMNGNSYRSGRFMSNGNRMKGNRGGYSREDSKDHMINKLEHLMNEANNDQDRQAIGRLIEQMQN